MGYPMFCGATSKRVICQFRSPHRIATACLLLHANILKSRAMSSSAFLDGLPKIAIGQLCSTSSKWNNLLNIAMCAGWSSHSGCSMLFLPECAGFLGLSADETLRAAEPSSPSINNSNSVTEILAKFVQECSSLKINEIPRYLPSIDCPKEDEYNISILDGIRTIAIASNLWISAGSIHVAGGTGEDRRVYNTHFILDNTGKTRAEYRKIHLFDVCIPGKVDLRESKTTLAGSELVVCHDTPIGSLGVTVCYDLRFPEMYTELVQKMGAQVLLVPSAFTVPTGQAHWHTLLRARAIENQSYVIAAAQYGQHNEKRVSYGHSLIVDGWGTVIADAGGMDCDVKPSTRATILTRDIDLGTISSIRERMPIQQHRDAAQFSSVC